MNIKITRQKKNLKTIRRHSEITNLILKIVKEDATRGTTTLVYLQLHISLYTGTVHVLSRVLEYIR